MSSWTSPGLARALLIEGASEIVGARDVIV